MRATRLAQALLRFNWFGAIPALLAGLWLRHGLPAPHASGPPALLALAELALRHPVPAYVLAFLLFAALFRYWRFYLPWGYCLAHLPPTLAVAMPRSALAELERAAQFRRQLTRKGEPLKVLDQAVVLQLDAAFQAGDLPALRRARAALETRAAVALHRRARLEMASFALALAVAAGAALLLRHELVQNYWVLSSSMLPTLERGDQLTANRRAYLPKNGVASLPSRGEVVIFHQEGAQDIVKRVIGLPGDEIRMHGGFPIINGWEVPHCQAGRYVYWGGEISADGQLFVEFLEDKTYLTLHVPPARSFGSYVVKPGEVFVLGDNRNSSLDSRNWRNGEASGLPLSALAGRVDRILLSPKRNGELDLASALSRLDDLHLNADGLNTVELRRQVQACVAARPEVTRPPAASATKQLSQMVGSP
jgi:signal peptidase I